MTSTLKNLSQKGFLDEIKSTGLSYVIIVGKRTPSQQISNDFLYEIINLHKKLLSIAGIIPTLDGIDEAIRQIDRNIDKLKFAGINIKPEFAKPLFYTLATDRNQLN
jgi:predicted TIM-barrel fold metal-dependent hydrolase